MQLLVSVATADDARAALAGGADIIDAKDPTHGALGAVSPERLREIAAVTAGMRPLTAAIGDASSEAAVEALAHSFASAGATLVKVGCAARSPDAAMSLLRAAVRGATRGGGGVVAVAYADLHSALTVETVVDVASAAGARGVLLDTVDKNGPRLTSLLEIARLTAFVRSAHQANLTAALAGRLAAHDLPIVASSGADIAGVRGAVCVSGRDSHVSADRVAMLVSLTIQGTA